MKTMSITNKSEDNVVLDIENYDTHVQKIKRDLTNINTTLKDLKKVYSDFANDGKTKGGMKQAANKIVAGVGKKVQANNNIKNSLETQILKTTIQYRDTFNSTTSDVGQAAEELNVIDIEPTSVVTEIPVPTEAIVVYGPPEWFKDPTSDTGTALSQTTDEYGNVVTEENGKITEFNGEKIPEGYEYVSTNENGVGIFRNSEGYTMHVAKDGDVSLVGPGISTFDEESIETLDFDEDTLFDDVIKDMDAPNYGYGNVETPKGYAEIQGFGDLEVKGNPAKGLNEKQIAWFKDKYGDNWQEKVVTWNGNVTHGNNMDNNKVYYCRLAEDNYGKNWSKSFHYAGNPVRLYAKESAIQDLGHGVKGVPVLEAEQKDIKNIIGQKNYDYITKKYGAGWEGRSGRIAIGTSTADGRSITIGNVSAQGLANDRYAKELARINFGDNWQDNYVVQGGKIFAKVA